MSCDNAIKSKVAALALGGLPPAEALVAERHISGCPSCAALRLALLEERAALKTAGAPLLSAGAGFGAAVLAAAEGREARRRKAAAVALVFAAGFAALMLFMPGRRAAGGLPPSPAINPYYAGNLSGGDEEIVFGAYADAGSDLFYQLSCRGNCAAGRSVR
jgi:anti-sigma factor RsiW